jgi:hypothetical protein
METVNQRLDGEMVQTLVVVWMAWRQWETWQRRWILWGMQWLDLQTQWLVLILWVEPRRLMGRWQPWTVLLQLTWQRVWKPQMWQLKQTPLLRQTRHQMMLRLMM